MLKHQSIRFHVVASILVLSFFIVVLGGLGLRSSSNTYEALSHFYGDMFQSVSKLQTIQDVYEGIVRMSVHRLLTNTVEGEEVIKVVDEGVASAEVHWKAYSDQERGRDTGARQMLNHELENAMDTVNVSWLTLKGIFKSGDLPKARQYIIEDFYPKLDALGRRSSQLMNRWMDQLESDRQIALGNAEITRREITAAFVLGILISAVLGTAMALRINRAIDLLAQQIGKIQNERTDFTQRIPVEGNEETNAVSLRFNYFLDSLLGSLRRVKISGLSVATAMPQISEYSKDMAKRIRDFGNFTTEVGATANEISATSQELVKLMTDVSDTATKTAELATSGQSELVRLESTMTQMEEASRQISKRLAVISEKAANITTVVTTINKFADQTNLLSLNASIEAEKAGEYGLGFAVVAREIRRLADQVALATLDIEQMVKEMKSAVSSGVMEMDKFTDEVRNDVRDVRNIGSQLTQIIEHVQTLLPCFESVHGAVQAQADGARQISDSMGKLSDAVDEASQSLKDASLTVIELTRSANDLQKEVLEYKVDVS